MGLAWLALPLDRSHTSIILQDWNEGWDTDESEGAAGADENPRDINFNIVPSDQVTSEYCVRTKDDTEKISDNTSAELLRVHHQFNHIGFKKLQLMAKSGILPGRLARCQIPVCSACMYGKATRRPWRDKPKSKGRSKPKQAKCAGQCVSVDMLKSPTPGLIAQIAGWITRKRHWHA